MSKPRVLRFPREDGAYVLVHVSSRGPHKLDLDLKGTENENPYFIQIYHDKLSQFKAKSSNVDETWWSFAVAWTFLQEKPAPDHRDVMEQLEVVASIHSQQGLVLKFRQNLEQGIKTAAGSIALAHDENQELDLFEWAGISTEAAQVSQRTVESLSHREDELQQAVTSLKEQLRDFQRIKKEEETVLLEKFRQLLNMKKLKIRDQQRLLAGAKINAETAKQVKSARQSQRESKSVPGRSVKRKAGQVDQGGDDEAQATWSATESEDDFETMGSPERSDGEEESNTLDVENSTMSKEQPTTEIPIASNLGSQTGTSKDADVKMEDDEDQETDDEL